jgi:hypothetical protein
VLSFINPRPSINQPTIHRTLRLAPVTTLSSKSIDFFPSAKIIFQL